MPLWTACLRTLPRNSLSSLLWRCPRAVSRTGQWLPTPQPLRASSNAASEANPLDDSKRTPAPTLPSFHPNVRRDAVPWFAAPRELSNREDAWPSTSGAEESIDPDVDHPERPSMDEAPTAGDSSTQEHGSTHCDAQLIPAPEEERPGAGSLLSGKLDQQLVSKIKAWTLCCGPSAEQTSLKLLQDAQLVAASSTWIDQFRKVSVWHDVGRHRAGPNPDAGLPTLHPQTSEWVEAVLDQMDAGKLTLDKTDLPGSATAEPVIAWTQIMLWLLAYQQSRALDFLLATHQTLCPHSIFITDCLTHLGAVLHHSTRHRKLERVNKFVITCCKVIEPIDGNRVSLTGPLVHVILQYCSAEQGLQLFQAIEQHDVLLRRWTYIHFVRFLADHGYYHEALRALNHGKARRIPVRHVAFRSGCSIILRASMSQPDGLRETLRVISAMVEMGMELDDIVFFNIIIINAVEANDLKTAFDVYHSLFERGLQPNEATFVAMLKACKTNINDVKMLNDVIHDAISNMNVRTSPIVADNILHCLALHHAANHPATALQTLVDAYAQFYDLEPLRRVGLPVPAKSDGVSLKPRMDPTTHALNFLIGAGIQDVIIRNPTKGSKAAIPLYETWCKLVASGDAIFVATAAVDYIFNNFLTAFTRDSDSLLHAARLVKTMQQPLIPVSAGVEQAKPTIWTWNIFLHGFTRHGKTALAEQVLKFMRKEGIPENTVTWNMLLDGYSRVGDVDSALAVVKEGFKDARLWDAWSDSAMLNLKRRVGSRARVKEIDQELVMLGVGKDAKAVDFTDELRGGLEERIKEIGQDDGFGDSPADLADSEGERGYRPF